MAIVGDLRGAYVIDSALLERSLQVGPAVDWKPVPLAPRPLGMPKVDLDVWLATARPLCWQLRHEASPEWIHLGTHVNFWCPGRGLPLAEPKKNGSRSGRSLPISSVSRCTLYRTKRRQVGMAVLKVGPGLALGDASV